MNPEQIEHIKKIFQEEYDRYAILNDERHGSSGCLCAMHAIEELSRKFGIFIDKEGRT